MFWAPSETVAADPSWCPTRRLARASSGMVGAVTAASAMPTQLTSGWSPSISVRTDSTATYPASRKKVAAIASWARRSATADPRRRPVNSHKITPPASTSIRLSIPNPIRAIEPAEIPAASAIANSATCHALAPQASLRARRSSNARSIAGRLATTGATLAFLTARYLLRDTVEQKFGKWLGPFQEGFAKNAFSYLLTLRLIPLFPFFVVNLVSGLTRVNVGTYVAATAIGIIPGSFVYAYAGRQLGTINSLKEIASPNVVGAFVLLGLLALVPVVYKKYAAKSA